MCSISHCLNNFDKIFKEINDVSNTRIHESKQVFFCNKNNQELANFKLSILSEL